MTEPRFNPHNPPGSGLGRTKRRNRRRGARYRASRDMVTITMDDYAYDRLPDRQTLTGAPILGQVYRDPGAPDYVFKWAVRDDGVTCAWETMRRVKVES